jgi:hypothetical protein
MTAYTDTIPSEPRRKRVGVFVGDEEPSRVGPGGHPNLGAAQARTLAALEAAFGVRFEAAAQAKLDGFDGLILIGAPGPAPDTAVPQLMLPAAAPPSSAAAASAAQMDATVHLADASGVPEPFRGGRIADRPPAVAMRPTTARPRILASAAGQPVWWRHEDGAGVAGRPTGVTVSSYPMAALGEGEALRDHLRAGRFMGLLPLVDYLRALLEDEGWVAPPLRAAFIVDDPNLHRPRYGFLDFAAVAKHATEHGYHLAMATVPIDAWFAARRAAAVVSKHDSQLSLLLHGNDHVTRELEGLQTDAEAIGAIAQALRRIAGLERRAGVSVDRVIAPPHGACSEAAMRAMFRLGLDAACVSRPYPWRDGLPSPTPLAGWRPAELVAGGLPVLPRYPLDAPREELSFRAFLGQPLILYGHHGDFADGLDVLGEAAAQINALGDVAWGPLRAIAETSFAMRRSGEELLVRLHARRVRVPVPAGVRRLRVVLDEPVGGSAAHRVSHPGGSAVVVYAAGVGISEPVALVAPGPVTLTLAADRPLQAAAVPPPRTRVWPWIRRALVEGRDRVQALR